MLQQIAPAVIDSDPTPDRIKLIEVALPLAAINAASSREKSLRHGHPSTLHLWWARRPLAACRAILFAALVDDPSAHPERFPTAEEQGAERARLFGIIRRLVQWENSTNPHVLEEARNEIRRSVGDDLPTVYDPFCGGGAIPIESQRLGLPTLATDINPVAVLLTKALTEIPWRFRGFAPVHPSLQGPLLPRTWKGATGLAADIAAYGNDVFEMARKMLEAHYPAALTPTGATAPTIAWLWARTVKCPNPICGATMPLVKTFALTSRRGKEWSVEPVVDLVAKSVRFETRPGGPSRSGTVNRLGATCIVCDTPVPLAYVRAEGSGKRMATQLLAVVADGRHGRLYISPSDEQDLIARSAAPAWIPTSSLPERALGFRVQAYGLTKHSDLFTSRQLIVLTALSDIIRDIRPRITADAAAAGLPSVGASLESGGSGAIAYADAIATYLALAVDRLADRNSNLCSWDASRETIRNVFSRQTLSMTWDFSEVNPFSESSGNFRGALTWIQECVAAASANAPASARTADARVRFDDRLKVVVTDPPYYDNVPYADLSDFFYIWLRRSVGEVYPETLATLLVPKREELIAEPARFPGGSGEARRFFEDGLREVFTQLRGQLLPGIPAMIFYAFKQTEHGESGPEPADAADTHAVRTSVGWEAMLAAVLASGFAITGTWPLITELGNRQRARDSNALASSVVLVCRPRPATAPVCGRAEFLRALRSKLPAAVQYLRDASLAATDLQQAALGPGMALFSAYAAVLEPDDSRMTVRAALALINEELSQILLGEIADVDSETHFALAWFDRYGYEAGKYGEADMLLRAKNASGEKLRRFSVLEMDGGLARLRAPQELPNSLGRPLSEGPVWAKALFLMSSLLAQDGGEERAALTLRSIGLEERDRIKNIAYHCYLVCDERKRLAEARDFNALVTAWPELEKLSASAPSAPELFDDN